MQLHPAGRGYSPAPIVAVGARLRELDDALAQPCVIVATDPMGVLEAVVARRPAWHWRLVDFSGEEINQWAPRSIISVKAFGSARDGWWSITSPTGWFSGPAGRHWGAKNLAAWGEDLGSWCRDNDLPMVATRGALGSRLLRDRRFFPEPRRVVPAWINDLGREHLPGNYYQIAFERAKRAIYYDQESAYHYQASLLALPDPDRLHAQGDYFRLADHWITDMGSRSARHVLDSHGLVLADISCPPAGEFCPPWFATGRQWLFTSELPTLFGLGGRIEALVAAWTSPDAWAGIRRYAQWSMQQLADATDTRRAWLKPALLATYGVLAARPRRPLVHSEGKGSKVYLPNGMEGVQRDGTVTSPVVHTLALGMIEAAVRAASLAMARAQPKGSVMGIYSDAVLTTSEPLIPPAGWRAKAQLTNVSYLGGRPTWYTSDQETKTPGVSR